MRFIFKPGLVTKTQGTIKGSVSADELVSESLSHLSVPFVDPCCPSATAALPVGINQTTGQLQKYDGTSWTSASEPTAFAVNTTATITAAQLAGGLLTSTSAAAVSITLPSATDIATALGAVRGSSFEFVVDNSAGSNTVTVVVGSGITVNTPAITGGATLTVSTANTVGVFRLQFTSTSSAKILRIA